MRLRLHVLPTRHPTRRPHLELGFGPDPRRLAGRRANDRYRGRLLGTTVGRDSGVRAEGDHRQMASSLDGGGQTTLVLGADACLAPGLDLVSVRQEPPEGFDFLIVDVLHVVYAEPAHLASGEVPWPSGPASKRGS